MTLSRKIKLKTTNSSAGPLKRFYEDSPLTDPEAQDPGLRITNYSGSYRVEYSLGNWSNNNELLRNVATDEQKTQWVNAYANPGQAADYNHLSDGTHNIYVSQQPYTSTGDLPPFNSLPRLMADLRDRSINRALLSENIREHLQNVPIDTSHYNFETEEMTVAVSTFYQYLADNAPPGIAKDHADEIIEKVRVGGATPIDIEELVYEAKRRVLAAPHTLRIAVLIFGSLLGGSPRYHHPNPTPWRDYPDAMFQGWIARSGDLPPKLVTEAFRRLLEQVPGAQATIDKSVRTARAHNSDLTSIQELDITNVADSLAYLVPKIIPRSGQFGMEKQKSLQNSRVAVYNAIKATMGKETIIQLIFQGQPASMYPYSVFDIQVTTPFVTRKEIYPLLELGNGAEQQDTGAKIDPEYSLYNKTYENAISGSFVTEAVLPNFYIYNLYASSYLGENGFRKTDAWQGNTVANHVSEIQYRDQLSLAGIIPETSLPTGGPESVDYLNRFSVALRSDEFTEETKVTVASKTQSMIFPATDGDMLWSQRRQRTGLPMHIETSFTPEDIGPVGEVIKNSGISTIVLESLLKAQDDGAIPVNYNTTSDYVVGRLLGTPEDKYVSSVNLGERPYKVHDISRILNFGTNGEVITSLVVTEKGLEPVTGVTLSNEQVREIGRAKRQIRSSLRWLTPNYSDILRSRISLSSESLGYILRKFDINGNLMQEILFGNTGDLQILSYIDTQVKYNTQYTYELSEFRLVYSPTYDLFMADSILPEFLSTYPDYESIGDNRANYVDSNMNPYYDIYTSENPEGLIIELPIYGSFYEIPNFSNLEGSVDYPTAKILDYPPTTPEMQILPLLSNYRQIKINIQQNTGDYIGKQSLDVVPLLDTEIRLAELYDYQSQFEYYILAQGKLGFKNEGINEIISARLYRTTELDRAVTEYSELYRSFGNDQAESALMTIDPSLSLENSVLAFDMIDTIEPNQYYYYTCIVEDVHGNPSNPSPIYRVRLVYEKGLYIPEIEVYNHIPLSNKIPTRKFARFMQIQASDIQTFPFVDIDENGAAVGTKNLAERTGDGLAGQEFIVRLTSRDTGRKFDVKVSFDEKLTEKFIETDEADE